MGLPQSPGWEGACVQIRSYQFSCKEHVLRLAGQVSKDSHKIIKSMSCEVGMRPQLKLSYQNNAKKDT